MLGCMTQIKSRLSLILTLTFFSSFAFYGFRALLIYYLVEKVGVSNQKGEVIFLAFLTLHFVSQTLCGWVSDRMFGNQQGVCIGGVLIVMGGCAALFLQPIIYYLGFALMIIGTSFSHVNLIASIGHLSRSYEDIRLGAFSLFKVVSNASIFLTIVIFFLIYAYGFGVELLMLSAVFSGLVISCLSYRKKWMTLGDDEKKKRKVSLIYKLNYIILLPLVGVTTFLIWKNEWLNMIVPVICIFGLFMAFHEALIKKLFTTMIFLGCLFLINICFLTIFYYASSVWVGYLSQYLGDYAVSFISLIEGHGSKASFYLPLVIARVANSLMILVVGPVYAFCWFKYFKSSKQLTPFLKTSIGLVLVAISFSLLALSRNFIDGSAVMAVTWFGIAQLIFAMGEMMILPVALAYVTKIAPQNSLGVYTGGWLMSGALAIYFNRYVEKFFGSALLSHVRELVPETFADLFGLISWYSFGLALIALACFALKKGLIKPGI
jgi:POT family proton-dependent oligopeptide transporter